MAAHMAHTHGITTFDSWSRNLQFPVFSSRFSGTACFGGVAQLGEHLLCTQEVVGSNPIFSIDSRFCTGNRRNPSQSRLQSHGFTKEV